jgi:hypothetical protein
MNNRSISRRDDDLATPSASQELDHYCGKCRPSRSTSHCLDYFDSASRSHGNARSSLSDSVLDLMLIQELDDWSEACLEDVEWQVCHAGQ